MTKYRRNAESVLAQIHVNQAGQAIVKQPMTIMAPVRFTEIGLGQVGIDNYLYGLFAVILETGEYSVMNVNALISIDPFKTLTTTIDEVEYHVFYFKEGDVLYKTIDLVQREAILFRVFDEFIFKGKVPWYVDSDDMGSLFATAAKHAGSRVANNPEVMEFIASLVTRSKKDRMKYLREVAETLKDFSAENTEFVPLKSIFYSVKSTVNKLTGSYFNDGVVSALVTPTTKTDKIESILRA